MPRHNYISIKASPDEKLRLKLEASRLGVSLSDYIRMRAFGLNLNPSPVNLSLSEEVIAK